MIEIPKSAATILIVNDENKDFQILMLKRQRPNGSFSDAHVFPGGVVEKADYECGLMQSKNILNYAALALELPESPQHALAFFLAAIRETAEESGILLTTDKNGNFPSSFLVNKVITQIQEGKPFYQILENYNLKPFIEGLLPISWWITPAIEKRRYDTRFFAAIKPYNQTLNINFKESVLGEFLNPSLAVRYHKEAKLLLPPPTLALLEMAQKAKEFSHLKDLFSKPNYAICPETGVDEVGNFLLLLPGDPLHTQMNPSFFYERTRFQLNQNGRFF